MESFPYSFPLKFDFINDCFLDLWYFHIWDSSRSLVRNFTSSSCFLISSFNSVFIMRIFDRIMSKVEAFTLMNGIANPFAKISIPKFSNSLAIFFNHELFKVIEIEWATWSSFVVVFCGTTILPTEIPHNVFYSYISIVISVESQESFSYWVPIVWKLLLQSFLKKS